MQFIASYFDDFVPISDYVPEYWNGGVGYPVIEVYKNGKRVDGINMIRTQEQLQNLIVKNGGIIGSTTTATTISTPKLSNVACEGQSLKLNCPSSQKVKITNALWGRLDNSICCTVPSQCMQRCRNYVTSLAQGYCQSTSSCSLQASNAPYYVDPCSGVSKYLQVDYTCV